jgi:renalase
MEHDPLVYGEASMNIALIGAGAAGSACVSVLRSRGADFCIFEKSRGPGGRLATRRVSGVLPEGDLHYDHGAPVFSWSDNLTDQLSSHLKKETVKKFSIDTWVACPSMPQLVKDLLGGSTVRAQIEIDALEGSAGNWFLREKSRNDGSEATVHGPFTAVVLTAPAPQTRALLRNVECSWKNRLEAVSYDPCWALMVSLPRTTAPIQVPSEIFSSVICQSDKPGRTPSSDVQSWVGHASSEWSKAHLEHDQSAVQEALLIELRRVLGLSEIRPLHVAVHRWRYSTVANALHVTALADTQQGLFFASDACLGTGVAGAVESGLAIGRMVMQN